MDEYINIDEYIDNAVKDAFERLGVESVQVKQEYYQVIQKELNDISIYMVQKEHVDNIKRSNGLTNPYAPEFGFSQSTIAYEATKEKKEQAIIYNKLNKILSYLRQAQEITYALYIKSIEGKFYRYEVPESEIENFTSIVQQTVFRADDQLREYASTALERLKNAELISQHLEQFLSAIDATGLSVKLADKYEAFEYHYQNIDQSDTPFSHTSFNIEGIRRWILGRGHDTAGWWMRGDVGLTSVKSVNLQNKFIMLNLASKKSLQEVYKTLKEIFETNNLSVKKVSQLVKAFTPVVYDLKKGMNVEVNQIVDNLINSLIK